MNSILKKLSVTLLVLSGYLTSFGLTATHAQLQFINIPSEEELLSSSQNITPSASKWVKGHKSRVRIISGDTNFAKNEPILAGVQLQIDKGWKTYWRSPGDTGVPPSFDWSGSRNLKDVSVEWPAPKKYKDAFSTAIGYKREVILPLKLTVKDQNKPVHMKLRFGYGICADICVPVEKKLKLTIQPYQFGHNALLAQYQSRVPTTVTSTGKEINGFAIKKILINLKGDKPNIMIDALVPVDTQKAELFVEASNGFYLPLAIGERPSAGGHRRFHIDLTKGDPVKGLKGKTLALTLVGDKSGIEYTHKVN